MADDDLFARLRPDGRVWAIASIHGEADRLARLAALLVPRLRPGDRLVATGNVLGRGPAVAETVDRLLALRRRVLALPGARACDVAFLRGAQEEMWTKLQQLAFALGPVDVLRWMLHQGLGSTLAGYGLPIAEAERAARDGPMAIARWLGGVRDAVRARPGHEAFFGAIRRAALCAEDGLLFVSHGVDPTRPLDRQGDAFWWGTGGDFGALREAPFGGRIRRVVRGYDRAHPGLVERPFALTVDGGCGMGGPLLAAALDRKGDVVDRLEA